MTINRFVFLTFACWFFPNVAWSALIASDNFESYSAGTQLESGTDGSSGTGLNGGSSWNGAYNIDNALKSRVTVQSQSLTYSGGAVSVNGGSNALVVQGVADSTNLLVRPINNQTGTVYFSFLYRTNQPTTEETFLQVGFSNLTSGEPRGSVGTQSSTTPTKFFVRIPVNGDAQFISPTDVVAQDTTYFLVGVLSIESGFTTYNKVSLYVNPTTLTEPITPTISATDTGNDGAPNYSNFMIRFARSDARSYMFDNLLIGTTYADVVPAPVPEPSAFALLGLGIAGFAIAARRRKWHSN